MIRTRIVLYASLLGLLLAACDDDDEQKSAALAGSALAQLERVTGEARLERQSRITPAAVGPLLRGDAVETGPTGSVVVRLSDGRSLEVGSDARFLLGKDDGGLVLEVQRGLVLTRVPASGNTPLGPAVSLRVLTPFGLTRLGTGQSEVNINVRDGSGEVEVRLGSVEFVGSDGEARRAEMGQTLAVAAGKVELIQRVEQVVSLKPILVTVRASGGAAELRKKGSTRWQSVKAAGEPLEAGDALRTRQGPASLSLENAAAQLGLKRGTELVFEGAGVEGTAEEARLELRKGKITLQLAGGRRSRVVLPDVVVESLDAASVELSRVGKGFTADALVGDVTVVHQGTRQALRAGERVLSEGASGPLTVETRAQADFPVPPKARQQIFHPGLAEVALVWEGEGDSQVEVASDKDFQSLLLSGRVHASFLNVPAPPKGALYWRIKAVPGGALRGEGSAFFAPEPPFRDLARLRNEVPEGPDTTTIFYQDKPPAVTFVYPAEPRAIQYRISVYRAGSLSVPVAERTVNELRAPFEEGLLGEGNFVWSVVPLSPTGEALRGGRMNKLDLVYDNSVPTLVVTSPKNGDNARAGRVLATGVAPLEARLWVNDRPAPLDTQHRFGVSVTPLGRLPLVWFKMVRPGNSDLYIVRILRRGS